MMWPFSIFERDTHRSCRKRAADLDDRISTLEGQLEHFRLDFEDRYEKLYDRLARVYGRLTKRHDRDEPEPNGTGVQTVEAPPSFRGRTVVATSHLATRFRHGG